MPKEIQADKPKKKKVKRLEPLNISEPPRKKKKKVSTALVVPERKRLSKTKEKLTSIIADDAENMLQMLEDGNNDSATSLIHKRLLQSLVEAVAHAEHNVRETRGQKSVYQLNSLITSIRELLIDVQSNRDRAQVGQVIVEQAIRPAFLDLGMVLVQQSEFVKGKMRNLVDNDAYKEFSKLHDEFLHTIANEIQTKYRDLQTSILKHVQG